MYFLPYYDIRLLKLKRLNILIVLFWIFICSNSQQVKEIEILHANSIEYDESLGIEAKRLLGDVSIQIDDAIMFCDSAYYFSNERIVDAYNNVHVTQGDTLNLYGDYMKYTSASKLINIRGNVVLIDKDTRLTTDALDYNTDLSTGYYYSGGIITNEENRLTSIKGYYQPKIKTFIFSDSVVITNPDYKILSDSIKYNSIGKMVYFLKPTQIFNEENYIYCEDGDYNTETKIFRITKNAFIQSDGRTLMGDSLYYDNIQGYGNAWSNVQIIDTSMNAILQGHYAEYFKEPQKSFITDSALLIQIFEADTFFVHADTLRSEEDTAGFEHLKAYYKVKLYKSNIQGKCDSVYYSSRDSILEMYYSPVMWSGVNQISAEFIKMYMKDDQIDRMDMTDQAFIISRVDSTKFNQIKGRKMAGYFRDNEIYRIDVMGNGQTIYFPVDGDEIIGVNKGECSDLKIFLKERKVYRMKYLTKPKATLYPLGQIPMEETILSDFKWLEKYRPLNKMDIFEWIE